MVDPDTFAEVNMTEFWIGYFWGVGTVVPILIGALVVRGLYMAWTFSREWD